MSSNYNNHTNTNTTSTSANSKYDIPLSLLQSPLKNEIQIATELAIQAGYNMYRYCDEKGTIQEQTHNLMIETKGQPEDFCTKIDIENERFIINKIQKEFPTHMIIGEETTGTGTIPTLTDTPTWIIDPIDGTTNFASGLPLTCVSIGLCVNRKPVLGVVFAPMTDELYLSVAGHGAYRNGIPIFIRNTPNKTLTESVVCFEFGYAREKSSIDLMIQVVQRILYHGCRTTRSLGSGVLDLCYVATGRIDVVYTGVTTEGWKPWDYCAGYVIAKECGCTMEAIVQNNNNTDDFDIYSPSLICAVNPSIVKELRKIILEG
jgi:fructose-1,6-bisphosphatase/inositol monophosphatase family enzyme